MGEKGKRGGGEGGGGGSIKERHNAKVFLFLHKAKH